jgi:hypothetical protein
LAGSPPSSSFLPSSVSRNEAARCGDTPGVILASNELSSGNGGGVDCGDGSTGGLISPTLACLRGSLVSLVAGAVAGALLPISCSRILGSCGNGRPLNSAGGGGGEGADVWGSRGAAAVLLLGGIGAR